MRSKSLQFKRQLLFIPSADNQSVSRNSCQAFPRQHALTAVNAKNEIDMPRHWAHDVAARFHDTSSQPRLAHTRTNLGPSTTHKERRRARDGPSRAHNTPFRAHDEPPRALERAFKARNETSQGVDGPSRTHVEPSWNSNGPCRARDGHPGARNEPSRPREPPKESRSVVHVPCGECGVHLSYVPGDTGPLIEHMSTAHPRRQVMHFGSSDADEIDDEEAEPANRVDCSACLQIKEQLLSHLGQYSNGEVIEREGDSEHVRVRSPSEIRRVKINLHDDKKDMPKRSRTRFTRTMKNDDQLYETEKTRAKRKHEKPLSRELPMALRYLKQCGIDVGIPEEGQRTMVFRPAGKMYRNFRKFTCPACACEWPPSLSAIMEGGASESTWMNSQCFLTTCWPLMLLPVFYAQPTVSFHMRCANCAHYLGKLDRSGSLVAEVVIKGLNDASTPSYSQSRESISKVSGPSGDSRRAVRSR